MNKVFAVIRREFIERVRTKAFILSTFGLPLLMVAIMVLPILMMSGSDRTIRLAVVDATGEGDAGVGSRIVAGLERPTIKKGTLPRYAVSRVIPGGTVEATRDSLILETGGDSPDRLDGVLVLPAGTLVDGATEYYGTNAGSLETMGDLQRLVSGVVVSTRLEDAGVDPAVLSRAMQQASMRTIKVSDGKLTGESGTASFFLAYVMGFVLYIAVLLFGQQTMLSVIEEKNSRIMEILASSLRPFQMLMGKVLGVGAVGILQMGIWGGTIYLLGQNRDRIAGIFNLPADAMAQLPIPTLPTDLLIVFMVYFALGFLVFGALYAAVGAMVNSTQEAQQAATGVTMLIMVGFFGMFAVIKDPNGSVGSVMSLIPFTAPFVMPVRWSMSSVPITDLALSLAAMIAGLLLVVWVAGKIYRTGILMYGKKPSLREVFRWIRS
ncbi:MAG: ABC transporter permease [Gemmatimonadales bacterium]|nr:ABC transporter permease [Gemmatimonadales bacterium]